MRELRAVTLSGYLRVAQATGLDGPQLLREFGLSPEVLSDPDARLPARAVIELIDRSVTLSGCENFGILLAEARSVASVGPFALLLERLPNPREMMLAAIDFQRHVTDLLLPRVEDVGGLCLFRLDLAPGFWSTPLLDQFAAMGYRILTTASGQTWQPERAHLVRPAPRDMAPWRRVFRCPIEFGSTFNGLSCQAEAALRRNPNADQEMAGHARRLLNLVPIEAAETLRDRVRRTLIPLLPSGRATIDQVARQLGMSRRNLQRRLDEEGQPFGAVLAALRTELASAYLINSAHPITTIAGLLGYASPSSFTRWFGTTFGMSPQAWRQAQGQAR